MWNTLMIWRIYGSDCILLLINCTQGGFKVQPQ